MNVDWPRWIKASLTDYFVGMFGNKQVTVDSQRAETDQENKRFSLRYDGPDVRQGTHGEYWLEYTVNVLISSSSNEEDIYAMDRLKGFVANAFIPQIPIYKYGTAENDSGDAIGCVTLKTNIDIKDFSFTDGTVSQASVQALYRFEPFETYSVYEELVTLGVSLDYQNIDNGSIVYNYTTVGVSLNQTHDNNAILYDSVEIETNFAQNGS